MSSLETRIVLGLSKTRILEIWLLWALLLLSSINLAISSTVPHTLVPQFRTCTRRGGLPGLVAKVRACVADSEVPSVELCDTEGG